MLFEIYFFNLEAFKYYQFTEKTIMKGTLMNRFLFPVIAIFLLSCSGLTGSAKREFVDHTFHAVNPNISVKLSETFERYDQLRDNEISFYSNSNSGTNTDIEKHIFVDRLHQREFTIIIMTLNRGYWRPNLNLGLPNTLENGKMEKSGRQYYYAVYAYKSPNGTNHLVKRVARSYGASNNVMITYYYFCPIDSALGNFDQWRALNGLNDDQRNFLAQFKKDFEADVTLLK